MQLREYILFLLVSQILSAKYAPAIKSISKPFASAASSYHGLIANITADMPDEQRLFYTLMNGYEKAVRPIKKASDPVVVKLGITLTQIMDIVRRHLKNDDEQFSSLHPVFF